MDGCEIKYLADCKHHICQLARLWHEEVSRHWNPDASIEKAEQRLISHANTDKMPMAFAAIYKGQPIGMACLRENDGIMPLNAAWLGSLVVHPEFRRRKVGEVLQLRVMNEARKLGHEILYLLALDPTIPDWYSRLGWKHLRYDKLNGHCVTVMSIKL